MWNICVLNVANMETVRNIQVSITKYLVVEITRMRRMGKQFV
jgi:hypothetical protein